MHKKIDSTHKRQSNKDNYSKEIFIHKNLIHCILNTVPPTLSFSKIFYFAWSIQYRNRIVKEHGIARIILQMQKNDTLIHEKWKWIESFNEQWFIIVPANWFMLSNSWHILIFCLNSIDWKRCINIMKKSKHGHCCF